MSKNRWKLDLIFGKTIVSRSLRRYGSISPKMIRNLFNTYKPKFYTNKEEDYVFSFVTKYLEEQFGELQLIDYSTLYSKYGTEALTKAIERVYVEVDK